MSYATIIQAVSHHPELCALYGILRVSQQIPEQAREGLFALRSFVVDEGTLHPEEGLHDLDIRLNDLGNDAQRLATEMYEGDEASTPEKRRVTYATHFLVMGIRKLATAAWAAVRAQRNPAKREDVLMASADAIECYYNFLAFLEEDVSGAGKRRADAALAELAAELKSIPPFPADRAALERAAAADPAAAAPLRVLLG